MFGLQEDERWPKSRRKLHSAETRDTNLTGERVEVVVERQCDVARRRG